MENPHFHGRFSFIYNLFQFCIDVVLLAERNEYLSALIYIGISYFINWIFISWVVGDERIPKLTRSPNKYSGITGCYIRLDRWFRTRYPGIGHGVIEKLLRTGQIRVDGRRVKASFRLEWGKGPDSSDTIN